MAEMIIIFLLILIVLWFAGVLVLYFERTSVSREVTEERYRRWVVYMVATILMHKGEVGDITMAFLIFDAADRSFREYMARTSDEEVLLYINDAKREVHRLAKKHPDLQEILSKEDKSKQMNLNDGE